MIIEAGWAAQIAILRRFFAVYLKAERVLETCDELSGLRFYVFYYFSICLFKNCFDLRLIVAHLFYNSSRDFHMCHWLLSRHINLVTILILSRLPVWGHELGMHNRCLNSRKLLPSGSFTLFFDHIVFLACHLSLGLREPLCRIALAQFPMHSVGSLRFSYLLPLY